MITPEERRRWSRLLRHTARTVIGEVESGQPASALPPELATRAHTVWPSFLEAGEATRGVVSASPPPGDASADVRLWRAVIDRSIDVDQVIGDRPDGPLFEQGLFRAIEVWTEADLCGLHALWRLARARDRDDWRRRVAAVRSWHLEHTQPDNATNRPWALHVFLLGDDPAGRMYAETLLHNAMALEGRPDWLSACVLLDAASEL